MASEKMGKPGLTNNAFGKLVKSFREQRGWSQGELANEIVFVTQTRRLACSERPRQRYKHNRIQ